MAGVGIPWERGLEPSSLGFIGVLFAGAVGAQARNHNMGGRGFPVSDFMGDLEQELLGHSRFSFLLREDLQLRCSVWPVREKAHVRPFACNHEDPKTLGPKLETPNETS